MGLIHAGDTVEGYKFRHDKPNDLSAIHTVIVTKMRTFVIGDTHSGMVRKRGYNINDTVKYGIRATVKSKSVQWGMFELHLQKRIKQLKTKVSRKWN